MKRDSDVWDIARKLLTETELTYQEIGERIGRSGQAVRTFCVEKQLRGLTYLNRPDRPITEEFRRQVERLAAAGDIKVVIADKLGCNLRDVFRVLVGDAWLASVFAEPERRTRQPKIKIEETPTDDGALAYIGDFCPYRDGQAVHLDNLDGFIAASALWILPGETKPLLARPLWVRVHVRHRRRCAAVCAAVAFRRGTIETNAKRALEGKLGPLAKINLGNSAIMDLQDDVVTVVLQAMYRKKKPPPEEARC